MSEGFGHLAGAAKSVILQAMESVSKKEKIIAAISYIPFPPLFLIALFASPRESLGEYHGKQGLAAFLAWFVIWILSLVPLVAIAAYLCIIALIIADIVALTHALLGRRWAIPWLGAYAQKIKF
jgi:uncharacterized membrane protein